MSLDEAQNNLQNALVTTYLANLAFLANFMIFSNAFDRGNTSLHNVK